MVKENKLFSYQANDNVLEIKMVGEIDHHSAVSVRADMDALIFERRPKKLVLDLSEISFMDSSGLGLIMGRYSLVRELGGTLLLRSPTAAVTKILALAGMERIIKIERAFEEDDENEEN